MRFEKDKKYIITSGIDKNKVFTAEETIELNRSGLVKVSNELGVHGNLCFSINNLNIEEYKGSTNKKIIKIKYFTDITPLESIEQGDLIDLRCAEDTHIIKGEFKLIPLGVAMQLPSGYKACIYPRSSTFKKYHILLANSVGQVDERFNGDSDQWLFPAYATEDTFIPKNDRIAQFEIIRKQPQIIFETVDKLENEDRGGIGSTGRS